MALTVATCPDLRLKKELTVAPGKGPKPRAVQELLCLAGHSVVVDGKIGPASLAAIAAFRAQKSLGGGAGIDQALMDALAQPLLKALRPIAARARFGDTVVAIAEQHRAEHPREIGGANRGPWVRLYMDGNEGPAWLWCAGFVTYLLERAAEAHKQKSPLPHTFSCDTIGMAALQSKTLIRNVNLATANPGDLFLIPKTTFDWVHVGIVVGSANGVLVTIEGNTNDDGSREGHEVCKRTRAPAKVDLVKV